MQRHLVTAALAALLTVSSAVAAPLYRVTTFDPPLPFRLFTDSPGYINDVGQLTSNIRIQPERTESDIHAFRYTPDIGTEDLGTLGGPNSEAAAINNAGQVTGASDVASGATHAFRYTDGIGMEDLGTLSGDVSSVGFDINNAGQVAGQSATARFDRRAFRYTDGVGMENLGTLGGRDAVGTGINKAGQVTGLSTTASGNGHAFRYTDGIGMEDLGTLGGDFSFGSGINNAGQVTGGSSIAGFGSHAFRYTDGIGMEDLGTLGGDFSFGRAINDAGQVVGQSSAFERPGVRAFLYDNGAMFDLNDLVINLADTVFLLDAYDINISGQILASDEDFLFHLLTPIDAEQVPEPAVPALLGLGVLGLAVARRKRRRQLLPV